MSKEQINELANDIAKICPDLVEKHCGQVNCVTHLAVSLCNIGWHKGKIAKWRDRKKKEGRR